MIKKRSKMNNIIMWGLIATASVSLASVGFASLVINTMVPDTTDNMDITVGAVSDKSITATAVEVAIDGKLGLNFDNLANGTAGIKIQNGDSKTEKLSFKIKTTLTISENSDFQDLLTSLSFTFNDALDAAVTGNYITMPFANDHKQVITLTKVGDSNNQFTVAYSPNIGVAIDGLNGTTFSYTTGAKPIDIITTFTCGWGSAFHYKNPGSLTINDTDDIENDKITLETFKSRIASLQTAVSGKTLNVTVTPNGI